MQLQVFHVKQVQMHPRKKLAIEPEGRNDDQIAVVFAISDRLLTADASDVAMAQQILNEVGRATLARERLVAAAHCTRPLEPLTGG